MGQIIPVLGYAFIPVIAAVIGGLIATIRAPGERVQGYVQHFAAGVVFAAVAGEVLPEIMREHSLAPAIIGFALGVVTMLGIKELSERMGGGHGGDEVGSGGALPMAMLITIGVDLLIDGLLVGVGFAAGSQTGLLLTAALTLEVLFLGLSTAAVLAKAGAPRGRMLATITGLSLMIVLGALIGVTLLAGISGPWMEGVLSFGAVALLYLVTEELLVEAHKIPDTPLMTASFFLGFLILFLIEMVVATPTV